MDVQSEGDGERAVDERQSGESAAPDEDFRSKYLYALAELENTKKRLQRRGEETADALKRRLLLKFLPVLDNLERSLTYRDSEGLRSGLAATVRSFESALESEGVTPILTTGTRFDPKLAEAIGTQRAEGIPDETVLAEAQRGYLVDDRVLRPAHVVVAKNE